MTEYTPDEEHDITMPGKDIEMQGILCIPENAQGIVLFAHGSGSSRFSSRNQYVAHCLNNAGLATLLFDLLTTEEEALDAHIHHLRFDIGMLSNRLLVATQWVQKNLPSFAIGYFGSSTGAAAALVASVEKTAVVKAIVSRGGRPDLAADCLTQVCSPTLLIVGEEDEAVIEMNESAQNRMNGITQLEIIPDATHLFEEPGTLDQVAQFAKQWFSQYLHY